MTSLSTNLSQQVACILSNLSCSGVLPWSRHTVNLLYKVDIATAQKYGYQGQVAYNAVPVIPSPKLVLVAQVRNINDVLSTVGDGAFSLLPQANWTIKQLQDARYVQIDGQTWSFIEGSIKDEASGIFFSGLLRRERENDNLVIVHAI